MKKAALIMMTLFLLPVTAGAQQKGGVELTSVAEVELVQKNAKGEQEVRRVEAAKANVVPGDTVIFTTRYVNKGDQPVTDAVIRNPVPEHMVYVDKSADGAGTKIEFSTDRGKTYGQLGTLKVRSADGKERPARAADVTDIRWIIEKPLAKGAKGSVSFRAKVK